MIRAVQDIEKKHEEEINKYKQIQKEYQKLINNRQHLESQLHENEVVIKELDCLKPGNEVYKLIGPVLIKQELLEAKENVKKRTEFIVAEIERVNKAISTIEKKEEGQRANIEKLEQSFQALRMEHMQKSKS